MDNDMSESFNLHRRVDVDKSFVRWLFFSLYPLAWRRIVFRRRKVNDINLRKEDIDKDIIDNGGFLTYERESCEYERND